MLLLLLLLLLVDWSINPQGLVIWYCITFWCETSRSMTFLWLNPQGSLKSPTGQPLGAPYGNFLTVRFCRPRFIWSADVKTGLTKSFLGRRSTRWPRVSRSSRSFAQDKKISSCTSVREEISKVTEPGPRDECGCCLPPFTAVRQISVTEGIQLVNACLKVLSHIQCSRAYRTGQRSKC